MPYSLTPKKIIGFVLLLIVAATFSFSAYTKLIAITPFEWSFIDLGFGSTAAAIAARVMVGLEFFIAALLLFHVYLRQFTYPLTLVVLVIFSIYLAIILIARGNYGNCGCFGEQFYMTPLEGLLKNIGLIVLVFILMRIYRNYSKADKTLLAATLGMASLAAVFVLLPMTKKAEPINLDVLYQANQKQKPTIDLRKGKHIIAFYSLTCPHCKEGAKKMQELYNKDRSLPFYAVLNGDSTSEKDFFTYTKLSLPHSMFSGPEAWVKMAGPAVPAIFYVHNSIKEREVNYMELNPAAIHLWLKQ